MTSPNRKESMFPMASYEYEPVRQRLAPVSARVLVRIHAVREADALRADPGGRESRREITGGTFAGVVVVVGDEHAPGVVRPQRFEQLVSKAASR